MFNKWLSPFKLRIISRSLLICGLLLVTTLVSWVLPNRGPHLAQAAPALPTATAGTWTATGSLQNGRFDSTATVLTNGQVLVAGGFGATGAGLASAELYDPATGIWTATGSLHVIRASHTATRLFNGKVLVVGGVSGSTSRGTVLASAELYDPASGTWATTGSMHQARDNYTATLLPDGRVLVAAGIPIDEFSSPPLASAELYDPATGIWTATGSLHDARQFHTAARLINGRVLVAGGFGANGAGLASAELYDPATGSWTATGSLHVIRASHTATVLFNGQVLVVGGQDTNSVLLASAELYDPATGSWTATGSLHDARVSHAVTVLSNGQVLVVGGQGTNNEGLTSAELYDLATGTWTATGSLHDARFSHTMAVLPNGQVLVTGGIVSGFATPLASAELYDLPVGLTPTPVRGTPTPVCVCGQPPTPPAD